MNIKDKIGCDVTCRTHSARTERDLYRICPSKISKRELEDLYFALLESNLELKKTVNIQQDKIKVLSTKVQRMAVLQKGTPGKEKDCCGSKSLLEEQRQSIANLKNTNEHMAERIRLLSMKLCSAKQFLSRAPSQGINNKSIRNSSLSALNTKKAASNIRTPAVSCQFLAKDIASARSLKSVETETANPEKENFERTCIENKCTSMIDELKGKITNLEEELSKSHEEYSSRISKLESTVSGLQEENLRVKCDQAASRHALQQRVKDVEELADRLRTSEARCNELAMELSIEKRKVQELETGLKLANQFSHAVDAIELLAASNIEKSESDRLHPIAPLTSHQSLNAGNSSPIKVKFANTDDSGYTELNKSCEADEDSILAKTNQELLKKIAELQTNLDLMRISAAGEAVKSKNVERSENNESDFVNENDEIEIQSQLISTPVVEPIVKKDSMPKTLIDNNTSPQDIAPLSTNEEADSSKHYEDLITGSHERFTGETVYDKNKATSSITITEADRPASKDEHNRYQIPGPIPVNPSSSKDQRKALKTFTTSNNSNGLKKKIANEEKAVKIFENNRDSYLLNDKDFYNPANPESNISLGSNKSYNKTIKIDEKQSKSVNDVDSKLMDKTLEAPGTTLEIPSARDSFIVIRKKLSKPDNQNDLKSMLEKESSMSVSLKCDNAVQADIIPEEKQQATQIADHEKKFDFCEARTAICRCPVLQKRDVAVFRSCSGTLRFRTTSPTNFRRCGCHVNTDLGTQKDKPSGTRRHSAANTYTVPVDKCERATSPDNTDNEISTMTDLPSEKDSKSPGQRGPVFPDSLSHSPGEEKATMTSTDTNTDHTDYGSLSEGELPITGRVRRLSAGERSPDSMLPTTSATSQRMEATLQSIGEELARCRRLLLSQRPQRYSQESKIANAPTLPNVPDEPNALNNMLNEPTKQNMLNEPNEPIPQNMLNGPNKPNLQNMQHLPNSPDVSNKPVEDHALRLSAANSKISRTTVPSCTFTLHISTLVLSDEAMLYFRDKSMIATWKFYVQNEAMTRLHPGRVSVFDFVIEYPVAIDDDFLEYMKRAEMQIALCELDYDKRPLAVCSLPLREALLHVNQRTDLSLVLAPYSTTGRAKRSLGDDFGVLDLWCMLTVDASLLPTLTRAVHPMKGRIPRKYTRRSSEIQTSIDFNGSARYDDEVEYRRHSTQTQKSVPTSDLGHKNQVGFGYHWGNREDSSGMIVSELPVSIKNAEEMKHALHRNLQQNVTRPSNDDTRSSFGSMKSLTNKQFAKMHTPKKSLQSQDIAESPHMAMKRDKLSSLAGVSTDGYDRDLDTYGIKHNNIGRATDSLDVSKKSVKYKDSTINEKKANGYPNDGGSQTIDITVLWLALNEECEAMVNPNVQQLYVAYSFLGRQGADLETPVSLPKPKHYADKCYFNFKKTFHLQECDLPLLGHMARCRGLSASTDPRDCLVFTLVSEPPEDPLGLSSCEDIGYAYLFLGDVLAFSSDSSEYTEVIGVRGVRGGICGVLAVRVDNLQVLRRCLTLSQSHEDFMRMD